MGVWFGETTREKNARVWFSSVLVNFYSASVSVKILTPLAFAAVTGSYFLPAHTELIKGTFSIPLRVSRGGRDATTTTRDRDSMGDLKRSIDGATFDLGHKTIETVDDVSRTAQANWDDIRTKAEKLADAYREVGQEQVNKVVDTSVQEAKYWLDKQKAEADRLLNETASVISSTAAAATAAKTKASSSSSLPSDHVNRFHDFDRANTASQNAKESAFYSQTSGDKPSSSRWSWWSSSDSVTPKKEVETKIHRVGTASSSPKTVERPEVTTTSGKPRKILVDKAVATAAIRQHDQTINRAAMMGKNAEETARKVHENVVDAALPEPRQGRHEIHKIDVSRRASESDYRDGKYIVRAIKSEDEEVERVGKIKGIRRDLDHGLQNLEKRAHMLYDGVEHLEHSLNKRMEKSLQDEADFWHQQSLKDEANSRSGDGAM